MTSAFYLPPPRLANETSSPRSTIAAMRASSSSKAVKGLQIAGVIAALGIAPPFVAWTLLVKPAPLWVQGLVTVSLVMAGLFTFAFARVVHGWLDRRFGTTSKRIAWIPFTVGVGERLVVTLLVARLARDNVDPATTGLITAMVGWTGLKLAAGWQRDHVTHDERAREVRARAFVGLLGSMLSLSMAYAGGLVWAGKAVHWFEPP